MKNIDEGLAVPKWVLIVWPKIPQMPENLSAQFVFPSPKVQDFNEKNLEEIQNQTAIGKIEKDRKIEKRSKDQKYRKIKKVQKEKGNKSPNRIWKVNERIKKKVIPKTTM